MLQVLTEKRISKSFTQSPGVYVPSSLLSDSRMRHSSVITSWTVRAECNTGARRAAIAVRMSVKEWAGCRRSASQNTAESRYLAEGSLM